MHECKICGVRFRRYNTLQNKCGYCAVKGGKQLKQRGKRSLTYEKWRNSIYAEVYERQHGRCYDTGQPIAFGEGDIHHVMGRGRDASRIKDKDNVVLLTPIAHRRRHNQQFFM